ncbi:hypothetical protein PISMIDRAFT_13366 [Pisolithus microcarpus 441]|uniref:Uncharacterized protein n=1 Tax=Pisolithus microcarpus 441 TaxID=765257 RepID=A0A0C9ZBM1_9AGAM|nr:hypothetical protein PISMIDRAFT_13366 [Pisolithus microcarpus 441]
MLAPYFELAGSCLVGEEEQQVMVMERQAVAMEWMASVQEAQVLGIQVYVQAMQGQVWLPFLPTMVPWAGVPQGGGALATEAVGEQGVSGMREGMKSGGLEQEDLGGEWGNEMDNE